MTRTEFEVCAKNLHKTALILHSVKHESLALFYGAFPENRGDLFDSEENVDENTDGKSTGKLNNANFNQSFDRDSDQNSASIGYVFQLSSIRRFAESCVVTLSDTIDMRFNMVPHVVLLQIARAMDYRVVLNEGHENNQKNYLYLHAKIQINHEDLRGSKILLEGTLRNFVIKVTDYSVQCASPLDVGCSHVKKDHVKVSYERLFYLNKEKLKLVYGVNARDGVAPSHNRTIFSKLDYNQKDDIFAFGTLIYLVCAHHLPYNRPIDECLTKIKRESIQSPGEKMKKSSEFSKNSSSETNYGNILINSNPFMDLSKIDDRINSAAAATFGVQPSPKNHKMNDLFGIDNRQDCDQLDYQIRAAPERVIFDKIYNKNSSSVDFKFSQKIFTEKYKTFLKQIVVSCWRDDEVVSFRQLFRKLSEKWLNDEILSSTVKAKLDHSLSLHQ